MSDLPGFETGDRWVTSKRGKKNVVDPSKPYAFLVEKELTASGSIEDVAVIFLTNTGCPFSCLMCDLWKNTTDENTRKGAIPGQIQYAFENLPPVRNVKLYNSGSFFDKKAIPAEDYEKIAALSGKCETVIVESHPRFIGKNVPEFRNMLKGNLEVAIGLETVHPGILRRLNKKMTLRLFRESVSFLRSNNINARAFILLRPPFLTEEEGVYWAEKSIEYAFGAGVECCTVIPVRAGNGAMDELRDLGYFSPPSIRSLEKVLEYGINLGRGRVFADTWDLKMFSECNECTDSRITRITGMNLTQKIAPGVMCNCKA